LPKSFQGLTAPLGLTAIDKLRDAIDDRQMIKVRAKIRVLILSILQAAKRCDVPASSSEILVTAHKPYIAKPLNGFKIFHVVGDDDYSGSLCCPRNQYVMRDSVFLFCG
jgi:hypothetical protein